MQQVPEIVRRHVVVEGLEQEVSPRSVLVAHSLLDIAFFLLLLLLDLQEAFCAALANVPEICRFHLEKLTRCGSLVLQVHELLEPKD